MPARGARIEPTTMAATASKPRAPASKVRKAAARPQAAPVALAPTGSSLKALARQLQAMTASVLDMAGTATDLGVTLARSRLKKPSHQAAVDKAGSLLRDLRQAAGLTVQDLGRAIGLADTAELERIESGKVAMPFELILRAASVLGRQDPVTFVMQATRQHNPEIWRALEALGVGKLVVQGAREREFANLYRARDAARKLGDAEFAKLLAFVGSAFDLALGLALEAAPAAKPKRQARGKR